MNMHVPPAPQGEPPWLQEMRLCLIEMDRHVRSFLRVRRSIYLHSMLGAFTGYFAGVLLVELFSWISGG